MLKEENGNRETIELIDMLIEENQELMERLKEEWVDIAK